jgi:hypothetical protein
LQPDYNICKTAGSMLRSKHYSKTLLKFKNRTPVTAYVTIVIDDNKDIKGIKYINTIKPFF